MKSERPVSSLSNEKSSSEESSETSEELELDDTKSNKDFKHLDF